MKVAVVGGGAAGFFAALSVKEHHPQSEVVILEKTKKLLSKVRVSGGGRCNVTNGSHSIKFLSEAYPRGKPFMKKALKEFNTKDTWCWFESRGVSLKVEEDGRVFPQSDNSETIIDCLMSSVQSLGINIQTGEHIKGIAKNESGQFILSTSSKEIHCDKVVIASGGSPKPESYEWVAALGHTIVSPIPSLFTFNMPNEDITELMGVVSPNSRVSIEGHKVVTEGPLLITHWGMSGPAILKASAFGAKTLHDSNHNFKVNINWINEPNQEKIRERINEIIVMHPKKRLASYRPFDLPERLWRFLLRKYQFSEGKIWSELGKKGMNKVVATLCQDVYLVSGKTTFKEEFVTCGGVSLDDINSKTMESKICSGMYFAGEVMDIDGVTGGFNFQAAWSTGYIAGRLGSSRDINSHF